MLPRRARLVVLVVLVALAGAACRVRTEVGVQVREDGSGSVTVTVTLDKDAVAGAPDIEKIVRTSDLTKTGWAVTSAQQTDGSLVLRAEKWFANPAEADAILRELSGSTGPLRDFRITRKRSFARTTTAFSGTVDFGQGLQGFSDGELTAQLGGRPLGEDIAAIEKRVGESLDKVFQFRVAVLLPGEVSSNGLGQTSNGAVWEPKLSDKAAARLEAAGRSWRIRTLLLAGLAAIAVLALVVILLLHLARRSLSADGRQWRGRTPG